MTNTVSQVLAFFSAALEDSVNQTGSWKRAKLLDWSDPGIHWPLCELRAAGEAYLPGRGVRQFVALSDTETLAVARALSQAAQTLQSHDGSVDASTVLSQCLSCQPELSSPCSNPSSKRTGRFALALADRETEHSGVYSTITLEDLLSSTPTEKGLAVIVDEVPTTLAAKWKGLDLSSDMLAGQSWKNISPHRGRP